jgi:soluble lytic murein transglycosylase
LLPGWQSRAGAYSSVETAQLNQDQAIEFLHGNATTSVAAKPPDARMVFMEGYRAYQHRDPATTIQCMRIALAQLPEIADYALFYLASAERDSGDNEDAANDFRRVTLTYPQSIWSDRAGLEYARLQLKLGHHNHALAAASEVVNITKDGEVEQNARLVMAFALLAGRAWHAAYNQLQIIRQKYPTGPADPSARQLAYAIIKSHPEVIGVPRLEYYRREAALLLSEAQDKRAWDQVQKALALSPPRSIQLELIWLSAEALHAYPDKMKRELLLYLELAPKAVQAPSALNTLAHLYWRANDTQMARLYFRRLAREFPYDRLAPKALFDLGRTYEDDGDLQAARLSYLDLIRRYPATDAADDARFRASFMLFMMGRYQQAAAEFADSAEHVAKASARDGLVYWQARALEGCGRLSEARRIFQTLALNTDSNYYPALAAMRVQQRQVMLPAPYVTYAVTSALPFASGPIQFHLSRIAELRELNLYELETRELRAVQNLSGSDRTLRRFVLAEFQNAGAWFDAIRLAIQMATHGELDPAVAERIRYPRGFWDWVTSAATRNQLDPYLVLALIRQESLFNPKARSSSDARGLMQLLPSTAERYAPDAAIPPSSIDLYDPFTNIQLGTRYLHDLTRMFGGNVFKAVAAYNAGENSVSRWNARYPGDDDQWVENIGFRETREYVKKVIGGMREYHLLYGSASEPLTLSR